MKKRSLTARQYLKLHPDKYVLVTYEFTNPVFIAPVKDSKVQVTPNREEAEEWSELDNGKTKLEFHKAVTGFIGLMFEKK